MVSKAQLPESILRLAGSPRLLPFSIACVLCAIVAVVLGYGSWYLWGERQRAVFSEKAELAQPVPVGAAGGPAEPADPPVIFAPAGELPVPKGTVTLSADAARPPRKISIEPFAIAESEVTNEQYFQFVKEAGRKPPDHWANGKYRPGTISDPVTHVSWSDAVAYCDWLSTKIGATVRLPSEAQWEFAAKGPSGFKYPWGNEWDEDAAASIESKSQVRPVKSFPNNRSPYGAYDMAGNVWEWVANPGHDTDGFPVSSDGVEYRIAKGGSVNEPREFITTASRVKLRADVKDKYLGFRYVVMRGKPGEPGKGSTPESSANVAARGTADSLVSPPK